MAEALESATPADLPDPASWLEHDGTTVESDNNLLLDLPEGVEIEIALADDMLVLDEMIVDFSVRTPESDDPYPWEAVVRTVPYPDPELAVVLDSA